MNTKKYTLFQGEFAKIPEHTRSSLTYYVTDGQPVGDFLYAVLKNDLQEAIARADTQHRAAIDAIARWIAHVAPPTCSGSEARIKAWYAHHGINGLTTRLVDAQ
jgi:hypothetical protein